MLLQVLLEDVDAGLVVAGLGGRLDGVLLFHFLNECECPVIPIITYEKQSRIYTKN